MQNWIQHLYCLYVCWSWVNFSTLVKCWSHSLMSALVCKFVFFLGLLLYLCVCFASLNWSICSLQSKCPLNSWRETLSVYVHFFIIQIYSHAENTSQICCCSNLLQGSFPLYLLTPNNIPTLSAYLAVNSCQLWNLWQGLTSCYTGSHLVISTINLIFHFNPIQTAVKNIIL